ncbi:MAG: DUF523 domain-containing protein [Hungatella sp.]|nr:DUF523 domain-containing protein [Hungatella sp.]
MTKILVSACLLGLCCRYDGKEKADERVLRLLERDDIQLVPVCPEQLGGMETPRLPSERRGETVVNSAGKDVTGHYEKGAAQALKTARLYGCKAAILKERSPSCGKGRIYDGTFSGTLTEGDGVTAKLLMDHGIQVFGESEAEFGSICGG